MIQFAVGWGVGEEKRRGSSHLLKGIAQWGSIRLEGEHETTATSFFVALRMLLNTNVFTKKDSINQCQYYSLNIL